MKKLFIMAVGLLTTSNAVFAGDNPVKTILKNKKAVTSKVPFKTVVIYNNIDVVLTEATDNLIEIKGEEKEINKVRYYVKNGTLYLESRHGSFKNNIVVYLSVNQLQRIEVNGKSKITSNGFLHSNKLNVIVNHESKFDLKTMGEIFFESAEGIYLDIEKWKGPQQTVVKLENEAI